MTNGIPTSVTRQRDSRARACRHIPEVGLGESQVHIVREQRFAAGGVASAITQLLEPGAQPAQVAGREGAKRADVFMCSRRGAGLGVIVVVGVFRWGGTG